MALQEGIKNLTERLVNPFRKRSNLGKPSKKRHKLGEDEDDWCDALNHLSVDSDSDADEEYFDAPEEYVDAPEEYVDARKPQVTSKLLPTGRKRKKAQGQKTSKKQFQKMREMNPFQHTSSTSGSRRTNEGKIKQRQRPSSPRHPNSGGFQFCPKDSSPSPLMETEPAGGSNTVTLSSSEADVQVGLKRLTSIHYPPQEHPMKGYTAPSTSTSKTTEPFHFGYGRSNTATSSFSESAVQVGPKQSATIHDPPQSQLPMKDYTDKGELTDAKLIEVANAIGDDIDKIRLLGEKLGFSRYWIKNGPQGISGTLRMLRDWKPRTTKAEQMPKLLAALKSSQLQNVADLLHREQGKLEKRKVTVTLMTSWQLSSIEGLKKKLMTLRRNRPDLIEAVKVLPLPFSGIQRYAFTEDVDIMVLCHSIVNRRFGITNVTDSLYDEFLNYCNKKLGKNRIAVIAHDFEEEVDEVRAVRMGTFKHTQWSTFEKAGLVMICGMMDKTPEIQEKDWNSLVKFLEDASKSTPANDDISQTMLFKKDTSDTKQEPKESEKDKKRDNSFGKLLGTSSSCPGGMVTRSRKPAIYICTSWGLHSVKGLKEKLQTLLKQSVSRYEIREEELPFSRLEDFKFPSEVDRTDAMILCHSVHNRGYSTTDVQYSIYDKFLKYCNRVFGKDHMAVIVHDFEDKPEILKIHTETFQRTQPTTYKLADFVALAGQLDVPDVKLCHDKSTSLETFVRRFR